ncbi:MAG: LTA synthase family protein, partial [Planctomycetota bacterium]
MTLITAWSVLNLFWLMQTNVQLHPGVLVVLLRDIGEFWPLAQSQLMMNLKHTILLIALLIMGVGYFLWKLFAPGKIISARYYHLRWSIAMLGLILVVFLVKPFVQTHVSSSFASETLSYSGHWNVLTSAVANIRKDKQITEHSPNIKLSGQRELSPPNCPKENLPNIVLVFLESVPYSATSLSDPNLKTTPHLSKLAGEGIELKFTYAPVPYTIKAFWAALTSTTPVHQEEPVEMIAMNKPYEGLPTILAKAGYRSAFFQMSKGIFECMPGFFGNLAFDWAWFRENLQDPSAYLGYMNGDDCRMIQPAVEWALKDSEPFFLMVITSVSHDPYELPSWYAEPEKTTFDKYIQT